MEKQKENNQITSKQRVRDHGEVFTQEREVNAMLDLVRGEAERIESRFLEPACGTGNFLAPVLERKLAIVKKRYGSSQSDFERMALAAASSIYGVEILSDNVVVRIK
jgi:type I restriction-modification system DNA methylase subunit